MKIIKDPIYGYVFVPRNIMKNIVDKDSFQRLRDIRQTSYAPIYHAAVHTRFSHSLGVYHLGSIAAEQLKKSYIEMNVVDKYNVDKIATVFKLACLLHDVGHAPFSHTGEDYYFPNEEAKKEVFNHITQYIERDEFASGFKEILHNPRTAPHEIMSVLIALQVFEGMIEAEHREFFARCIIGYPYSDTEADNNKLLNPFIVVLNSSIIDVDKIDYLIRDEYNSGYCNVKIDFERLLNALTIVEKGEPSRKEYLLTYGQSAISIIENVVYAYDYEKKWIQSHHTVLYDIFLIEYSIRRADEHYFEASNKKLFTNSNLQSCLEEGGINLLSDSDVLHYMKNILLNDPLINEFFNRYLRRKPLWKTQAEFRALFSVGEENAYERAGTDKRKYSEKLTEEMEGLFKTLKKGATSDPIINDKLLIVINEKIASLEEERKDKIASFTEDPVTTEDTIRKLDEAYDQQLRAYGKVLHWAEFFSIFAESNKIPFDFVIIPTKTFSSNFSKLKLEKILVKFPYLNKTYSFDDIVPTLNAKESSEEMFYLYAKVEMPHEYTVSFREAVIVALKGLEPEA